MYKDINQVFKSFDASNLDDFGLQKIIDVYKDFKQGEEIYFLDSESIHRNCNI